MVQLSVDPGNEGREDVNLSSGGGGVGGGSLRRGVGMAMTQSTQLTAINNNNNNNSSVTFQHQHHSDSHLPPPPFQQHPQGNGSSSPGKGVANGDVSRNGLPPGSPSARILPPSVPTPPHQGRSSAASNRPQESSSSSRQGVRMRRERDVPTGSGERPRDRPRGDRDTRDQDRWSYYGDPRVRSDQHFLRERDDRRGGGGGGGYRDDRTRRDDRDNRSRHNNNREERNRRDHRDRRDGSLDDRDRDRYNTPRSSGGHPDHRRSRDPEIEGGRDKENKTPPELDGSDREPEVEGGGDLAEERPGTEDKVSGDPLRDHVKLESLDEGRDELERPRGQDRDQDHETDRDQAQERHQHPDYRRARDGSYERRRRREYDRERDRSYERERERDRDLGRDRDHQPLRREPVGEETGYDSDNSRVSRSTAMSYATRSLGRRPRADSVASHVSMASHVSGRPPPIPSRTPRGTTRGYEEAYGSRELYEQYQQYYQYYRDHPYYKEYYRQWMKQYGQAYPSHESFYDDRTSIHSGRSSVNDELKKSISSGELSGVPSVGGDSASEAPQRLTPVKYGCPHINARFTPGGQLLFVLPKDPRDGEKAVVQLRDVQKMLCLDPTLNRCVRQMKSYPGPLTLADTHKDVVVRYCEQQAAEASKNQALPDSESVTLIWEYLALLVKQNGKLYGSDVAGLLLKGQDKASQPQVSASQPSPSDVSDDASLDGSPQDEGIDVQSQSQPTHLPPPRDESALLKKFTEYLCLGRKKEAVDYAMQEGLWGHALALSFKMDTTTHTRVLAAFSNSIPRNDVLLTLFQQLSGKRPEVTKSYAPHQWGNWRQHLAMMVSNPTGQSQRDKASVVALGETLSSRGQLHAAHFCYLVAEAEWGSFSNKESKLVLIGSSHHLPFQAFATNEAIQCTEIFEFARSLDTSNPVLETFQSYKLIYALRLSEYGFPSEALRYCEVIGQFVSKNPHAYQGDFLSQAYELGLRLKYHDLHYQMHEGEVAEMPDPKWLTNLAAVVHSVKHQEAEQQRSAAQSRQECHSSEQDYPSVAAYQSSSAAPEDYSAANTAADAYPQMGYSMGGTSHHQSHGTPDPYQGPAATGDTMDGSYSHQHLPNYPTVPEAGEATPTQNDVTQSSESGTLAQESTSPQPEGVPMIMQPQQNQYAAPYSNNYWPGYAPQDPNTSSGYMRPESAEASHASLPASPEVDKGQRSTSVTSMSQPNSLSNYPPYQQPYQGWNQPQPEQQQQINNSLDQSQTRSPDPSGATPLSPEEEAYYAEMTGKKVSSDSLEGTSLDSKDKSKRGKDDPNQEKGSGWSIRSLFGWKKSNQAVLPDDKNPSIVWNEEKKRWENKDGEEEVNHPPPPPPKFALGGPGAPPITMSRVGPRKSRYVNTEKDPSKQPHNGPTPPLPPMSGAPQMPGIPPMPAGPLPVPGGPMPPSGPPRQQFMVPDGIPQQQEGDSSSLQQPEQQQPQKPLPPTSLPDSSLLRRSRYISESSIELEEDIPPANTEGTSNDGAEGAVPMMAPPSQPQFFNPTQFNPPTTAPNPAQTRRVGPGKRLLQGKR